MILTSLLVSFILGISASVILYYVIPWYHNKREKMFTLSVGLRAKREYGTEFSQNPDYDPPLEGVKDSLQDLLKNVDGVSVWSSNISQVSKYDYHVFSDKRKRATIDFKLIIDDPLELDVEMLKDTMKHALQRDDRHAGVRHIHMEHKSVSDTDLRESYTEHFLNNTYTTTYNDKHKQESISALEQELQESKQQHTAYTTNNDKHNEQHQEPILE